MFKARASYAYHFHLPARNLDPAIFFQNLNPPTLSKHLQSRLSIYLHQNHQIRNSKQQSTTLRDRRKPKKEEEEEEEDVSCVCVRRGSEGSVETASTRSVYLLWRHGASYGCCEPVEVLFPASL